MSVKCTRILSLSLYFILFIDVRISASDLPENEQQLQQLYNTSQSNVVRDMGCRALVNDAILVRKSPLMSLIWCTQRCWKDERLYSYVKDGQYCFCGQDLGEAVASTECNIRCKLADAQTCGGKNVASVMFTGWVKLMRKRLQDMYLVCITERLMNTKKMPEAITKHDRGSCLRWKPQSTGFSSEMMSLQICIVNCFYNKFVYALLSMGSYCSCTSETPPEVPPGRPMEQVLAEGERDTCNFKCKGEQNRTCGGQSIVRSVWLTGHRSTTDALYQGYFFPMKPLQQSWKDFLDNNKKIVEQLTRNRGAHLWLPSDVKPSEVYEIYDVVDDEAANEAVPTSIIVGGVLGAVVLVALFIVVTHCIERKRKKNKHEVEKGDGTDDAPRSKNSKAKNRSSKEEQNEKRMKKKRSIKK